jgi:hypothetical protein
MVVLPRSFYFVTNKRNIFASFWEIQNHFVLQRKCPLEHFNGLFVVSGPDNTVLSTHVPGRGLGLVLLQPPSQPSEPSGPTVLGLRGSR